jgi:membrane protein DedA with SNARE-associated domain
LEHLIAQYGYLGVFVLMMAESACVPIPSELIMLLGGALAAGAVPGAHPLLSGIVAAGVLGSIAGSYIAWAVGRYAGQAAIRRWGRRVGIREHEIDKATAWFERHGPVAVLVGRVVPVIRTFISLPAGFADMPAGTFGLYTTLGVIPWTAALGIAGYAVGANWEQVANDFHGPTYVIAGVLVIGLVVLVVRRRRAKARGALAAGGAAPARTAGPREDGWGPQGPANRGPQGQTGWDPQGQAGWAPQGPADRGPQGQAGWGPPGAEPRRPDPHLTVR